MSRATPFLLIAIGSLSTGCASEQVRFSTVRLASKLSEIDQKQVLENLARTASNPASMPFFALLNGGTTSVTDTGSGDFQFVAKAYNLTEWTGGPFHAERQVQDNVTFVPIKDPDRLLAMRCAYQFAIAPGSVDPEACRRALAPYLPGQDPLVAVPSGWLQVGCKKDVPKEACIVAHYGPNYVWVMPQCSDAFTRFTLLILHIATLETAAGPTQVEVTFPNGTSPEKFTQPMAPGMRLPQLPNTPRRRDLQPFGPGLFLVPRPSG